MIWIKLINFTDTKFIMPADMSDSVKQKRPIQCPLFYRGFSFHMQGKKPLIDGSCKLSMSAIHVEL